MTNFIKQQICKLSYFFVNILKSPMHHAHTHVHVKTRTQHDHLNHCQISAPFFIFQNTEKSQIQKEDILSKDLIITLFRRFWLVLRQKQNGDSTGSDLPHTEINTYPCSGVKALSDRHYRFVYWHFFERENGGYTGSCLTHTQNKTRFVFKRWRVFR